MRVKHRGRAGLSASCAPASRPQQPPCFAAGPASPCAWNVCVTRKAPLVTSDGEDDKQKVAGTVGAVSTSLGREGPLPPRREAAAVGRCAGVARFAWALVPTVWLPGWSQKSRLLGYQLSAPLGASWGQAEGLTLGGQHSALTRRRDRGRGTSFSLLHTAHLLCYGWLRQDRAWMSQKLPGDLVALLSQRPQLQKILRFLGVWVWLGHLVSRVV